MHRLILFHLNLSKTLSTSKFCNQDTVSGRCVQSSPRLRGVSSDTKRQVCSAGIAFHDAAHDVRPLPGSWLETGFCDKAVILLCLSRLSGCWDVVGGVENRAERGQPCWHRNLTRLVGMLCEFQQTLLLEIWQTEQPKIMTLCGETTTTGATRAFSEATTSARMTTGCWCQKRTRIWGGRSTWRELEQTQAFAAA